MIKRQTHLVIWLKNNKKKPNKCEFIQEISEDRELLRYL